LKLHGPTGLLLILVALTQLSLVIAIKRKSLCPTWLVAANAGIIVALVIEAVCCHYHVLGVHVPLGLAIFGGVMRQLFWTMREPARDAEAYASMPICVNR
jgi:hypothetical protein